ncbi:MAG TPA: glycoside hydrolase family 36 protein [Capsulimonadaceae bacterium]|jgi:alpha-galactosidase
MTSKAIGINAVRLVGDPGPFSATLTSSIVEDGVELVELILRADSPARPSKLELLFDVTGVDIAGSWHPSIGRNRALHPNWSKPFSSSATSGAPVVTLFSGDNANRVTVALSDALRPVRMRANIVEENACFECGAVLFEHEVNEYDSYRVTLRIDRRAVPFYKSLNDVRLWWETQDGYTPAPVPVAARAPMYSTWYSFHQQVTPAPIEEQCRLAKEIGCDAVIVDDGWQCGDNNRGYAYCGDWEVYEPKIPDMAAHVKRVHDLGMKYILWYSVPFIGRHTKAWARFEDRLLRPYGSDAMWAVVDPRYPEVREYLIGLYEKAVREWDLDGFKLDFVDSFRANPEPALYPEKTDYKSVPEAVDRLLTDVLARLSALKPDICIEFRQSYIGPMMRKYGNMFRAGDCPVDAVQNRMSTVDVRLLAGATATHADMVMWHNDEPVESAALQLIGALFSVPQVSVLIDKLPADHREMLAFWLKFWREHRELLLGAQIEPLNPVLLYTQVSVRNSTRGIVVAYGPNFATVDSDMPTDIILVNGTRSAGVYLEGLTNGVSYSVKLIDCMGKPAGTQVVIGSSDASKINIPKSGLAEIVRSA